VRTAWLTLGSLSMPLEDLSAGYGCQSLDLGWPDVRDVVSNRPDADGIDDRTKYMGGRNITADITALSGAGARIDEVAAAFGPFMVPSARPVLHYVLDRDANTERTLTLRSSGYAFAVAGPFQRDIQLAWVAADPVARDPAVQTATAWAGTGVLGRVYNLVFPRVYPVGSAVATRGTIVGHGDVLIRPYLRIFGPITAPVVQFFTTSVGYNVTLTSRIDAGHFVGIDTVRHTAWLDDDPNQSVLASVDWNNTKWPTLPNAPDYTSMGLSGSGTTSSSQVAATWQDGYLT
jgi:hypothetical protein